MSVIALSLEIFPIIGVVPQFAISLCELLFNVGYDWQISSNVDYDDYWNLSLHFLLQSSFKKIGLNATFSLLSLISPSPESCDARPWSILRNTQ